MKTSKRLFSILISAFLGGVCISLGGIVYLAVKNLFPGGAVCGALLFTVGLFTICTRGYHLFTGKVCALFDNKPSYIAEVACVWLGNLIGTCTAAAAVNLTRMKTVSEAALELVSAKCGDSLLSLFLLGIFCNILIFIAVRGYSDNPHEIGKYLALFLGVAVFILSGTEHSVADMFYFAVSGKLFSAPGDSFLRLFIITLGNTVGGVLFPLFEKCIKALKDNA